jgi:hypothetical protein
MLVFEKYGILKHMHKLILHPDHWEDKYFEEDNTFTKTAATDINLIIFIKNCEFQ